MTEMLTTWRPGPTRDAIVGFLDAVHEVPVERRLAVFDNDGTLWCERPTYVQYDFFVDALRSRVETDPTLADRVEYAAVLDGDPHQLGEIGMVRIALALAELFAGLSPERFAKEAQDFLAGARHRELGRPTSKTTYTPMLELIDELRAREFTVAIVTGGGTEFVRAISRALYGVPPELVVGTLIGHSVSRGADGRLEVRRTSNVSGTANEGEAKVAAIQSCLGRRPMLAAGNSSGDSEMLEWTLGGNDPALALLLDHDDAEREFRYGSTSPTAGSAEPITDTATRLGWTVVSMRSDWTEVFGAGA